LDGIIVWWDAARRRRQFFDYHVKRTLRADTQYEAGSRRRDLIRYSAISR